MSQEEWLVNFIKEVDPEQRKLAADNALNFARDKFKKVMTRIFDREIAKVLALIEQPDRYSTREWEKTITDFEWTARRLACVAETMEGLRPLVKIDDPAEEPARVMCKRLLAESFMEL